MFQDLRTRPLVGVSSVRNLVVSFHWRLNYVLISALQASFTWISILIVSKTSGEVLSFSTQHHIYDHFFSQAFVFFENKWISIAISFFFINGKSHYVFVANRHSWTSIQQCDFIRLKNKQKTFCVTKLLTLHIFQLSICAPKFILFQYNITCFHVNIWFTTLHRFHIKMNSNSFIEKKKTTKLNVSSAHFPLFPLQRTGSSINLRLST